MLDSWQDEFVILGSRKREDVQDFCGRIAMRRGLADVGRHHKLWNHVYIVVSART